MYQLTSVCGRQQKQYKVHGQGNHFFVLVYDPIRHLSFRRFPSVKTMIGMSDVGSRTKNAIYRLCQV